MPAQVMFMSLLREERWLVTRNAKAVARFNSQRIAETYAAGLARAEAKNGNAAYLICFKRDGTVARETAYRVPVAAGNARK